MYKTILVLFVAVLAGTTGDLILSRGMKELNERIHFNLGNVFSFFVQTFQTPKIWMGICFMTIFFCLYLVALSRAEISFVLPLTALSYILTAIFARYIFHENVNWIRMTGTLLIFSGVVLVALSDKTKKPEESPIQTVSPSTLDDSKTPTIAKTN